MAPSAERAQAPDELSLFRRRNAWLLWLVALFSLAVNLLMLTGPIYMLQVYDRVLGSGSQETLVALTVLIVFLFLMMGILDHVRARVAARYGARLLEALDARVFRAALDRVAADGRPSSGLQDLGAVQRLTASPVFLALFDLPWTPLFLGAIFLFHPWLGWLATAGAVILVAVTLLNRASSHEPLGRSLAANRSADRTATELQTEAEVIRALGMGRAAFARWRRQRALALDEGMRAADVMGGYTTVTRTFRLFLQSAILGLGAYLVLRAEMTAGAMIAASILMGRALAPVELAIGQWAAIAEAGQARTRLQDLLRAMPAPAPRMPLPHPKARLEVTQLSVLPPGAQTATLRGVSFRIEPGQAIGVIGPSGSGKSTLARAMTGILRPAAGQIRLDGATLDQYDPETLGRVIGYLPQSVTLFDGTIAENIARLDPSPDSDKVVAAARSAAAHDMILDLPDGYETRVAGLGARLSGGQIQRIGLARALYGDPVLLVLDEPNSALDNDGSQALNAAIRAMKEDGRSVLIMAHRPAAIRECDKLLVLSGGVPTLFGPTQEVLAKTLANYADLKTAGASQGGVA
jgi:ATP-binding cassette, subfamily C, bacterial